jgi:hypothetical protein
MLFRTVTLYVTLLGHSFEPPKPSRFVNRRGWFMDFEKFPLYCLEVGFAVFSEACA